MEAHKLPSARSSLVGQDPDEKIMQYLWYYCKAYVVGSVFFLIASLILSNLWWRSIFMIFGSLAFILSCYCELVAVNLDIVRFMHSYECPVDGSEQTIQELQARSDAAWNVIVSMLGSTLYFIGSVLYLPVLDKSIAGDMVFICGSIVIVASQLWTLYRSGCRDPQNPHNDLFRFKNMFYDIYEDLVDLFAGIGGICFIIATFTFLLYDGTQNVNRVGGGWFILGSSNYLVSALCLMWKYRTKGVFPPLSPMPTTKRGYNAI